MSKALFSPFKILFLFPVAGKAAKNVEFLFVPDDGETMLKKGKTLCGFASIAIWKIKTR
jgi:hypothetical protein